MINSFSTRIYDRGIQIRKFKANIFVRNIANNMYIKSSDLNTPFIILSLIRAPNWFVDASCIFRLNI